MSKLDSYGLKHSNLGSGTYGQVDLYINNNKYYAIKKCEIVNSCMHHAELRESILLTSISKTHFRHPNIIHIYDIFYEDNHLYLIMPYFGCQLTKYIELKIRTRSANKEIIYQILSGLAYLHSFGYMHRDLSPSNILIVNNMIKIIDFSLTKKTYEIKEQFQNTPNMCALWYRAPEIIFGNNYYDTKIDMWSVGCIFAELLLGQTLFQADDEQELSTNILTLFGSFNNTIFFDKKKPNNVVKYTNDNPTFDMVFHHNNYTDQNDIEDNNETCYSFLKKLLELNPIKRISSNEALTDSYLNDVRDTKYEKIFTIEKQITLKLPQFYTPAAYKNIEYYTPLRRDCLMKILEVVHDQHMFNNTYFLTVTVFDKYLTDYWDQLDWGSIDLIALAILNMMAKFYNTEYLNINNASKYYMKSYTNLEIHEMEIQIMQDLSFDIDYSTVYDLLVYHNRNLKKSLKYAAQMLTTNLIFLQGPINLAFLAMN